MSAHNGEVFGIVVTYRPHSEELSALLRALAPQVGALLIVDNTPEDDDDITSILASFRPMLPGVRLLRMGRNVGIAAAQNIAIKTALAEGFGYVLLSDQDSLPAVDMVEQLIAVARNLQEKEFRVGCVCATYVDHVTGALHRFQVQERHRFWYSTCAGDQALPWVELVTAIASGSLIPVSVFPEVGLMREDYFIDFVDTEWCHRARQHGYKLFGTSLGHMEHRVGENTFLVWYGHWKAFSAYAPLRLRYRFRNGVFLLRSDYVPWRWKLRSAWTWLGIAYAYGLFAPNRRENVKAMLNGVVDGVLSRAGPLA